MSLLFTACSLAFVSVQQGQGHRRVPVEMEYLQDPPAAIAPLGRSLASIISYNGFVSRQVNVDENGDNVIGDAANEPSLTIDPTNLDRIAIGWRQFDNVSSNFRQGGYGYSVDGGVTWHFPGKIENNVFRSDPVLGTRYDGNFFYLSLMETFYDDIWKSLNGGASWNRVASSQGGDKQWFTIDNSNSSGRGFIYQDWSTAGNNYGGRQFTRSTDGGATWMNPIFIPQSPVWGTLDVDTNGILYLVGSGDNGPVVVRSSNAKIANQTPAFDLNRTVNLGGDLGYGSPINPDGLTGQLWIAIDKSSLHPNQVNVLASIDRGSQNHGDVMYTRSTDGGNTWSPAVRINDDPVNKNKYHWFGCISVSPTGQIDIVWNDTRDASGNATSSLYYTYSLDGGQTFAPNIRVSPSFNQSLGYPNQNKMGDYIGVLSNSRGANIAYTATFNGEQDVYFMNIPPVQVVAPSAYQIVGGGLQFGGGVALLANDEGNALKFQGTYRWSTGFVADLIVDGTSPSLSPKSIVFKLVSKDEFVGQIVTVSLYNWNTSSYEVVKTTTSTSNYSTVLSMAPGDASRFVNPATGAVKADIRYAPPQPGLRPDWTIAVDQAVWQIIP